MGPIAAEALALPIARRTPSLHGGDAAAVLRLSHHAGRGRPGISLHGSDAVALLRRVGYELASSIIEARSPGGDAVALLRHPSSPSDGTSPSPGLHGGDAVGLLRPSGRPGFARSIGPVFTAATPSPYCGTKAG